MALTLWSVPFSQRDGVVATGGWDSLAAFLKFAGGTSKAVSGQTGVVLPRLQGTLRVRQSDYDRPYNLVESGDRAYWVQSTEDSGVGVRLGLTYDPLLSYAKETFGFRGLWSRLSSYWRNAQSLKAGGFALPEVPLNGLEVGGVELGDSPVELVRYQAVVLNAEAYLALGTTKFATTGLIVGEHTSTKDGVPLNGAKFVNYNNRPFLVLLGSYPSEQDLSFVSGALLGLFDVWVPKSLMSEMSLLRTTTGDDPLPVRFSGYVPYAQLRKSSDGSGVWIQGFGYEGTDTDVNDPGLVVLEDGTLQNNIVLLLKQYLFSTTLYPDEYLLLNHPDLRKPLVIDMSGVPASGADAFQFTELVNTSETVLAGWQLTGAKRNVPYDPLYETSFTTNSYATTKWQDYLSSNPYEATIGRALNYLSSGLGVGTSFTNSAASLTSTLASGTSSGAAVATPLVSIGLGLAQFGVGVANGEGRIRDMQKQQGASASQMERHVVDSLYDTDEMRLERMEVQGGVKYVLDYVLGRFGAVCGVYCSVGDTITASPFGEKVSTDPAKQDGDYAGYCFAQGAEVQFSGALTGTDYEAWQSAFASGVELYYAGAKKFRPYNG